MNKQEEKILNQIIADIVQMRVNVQQTHWYMRGKQFFNLHPLMDDYIDQLSDQLDNIAERMIAIGGSPIATTHEFIDTTDISDEKITWDKYSLVGLMEKLLSGFQVLQNDYKQAIEITENADDFPTQDMINDCKIQIDKNIWMINSYLDK